MSTTLTINGIPYPFPVNDDQDWGYEVTNWATAITGALVPKSGGTYNLTGQLSFGTNYGISVKNITETLGTGYATQGFLKMQAGTVIGWKNAAGTNDNLLGCNSHDKLVLNGVPVNLPDVGYQENAQTSPVIWTSGTTYTASGNAGATFSSTNSSSVFKLESNIQIFAGRATSIPGCQPLAPAVKNVRLNINVKIDGGLVKQYRYFIPVSTTDTSLDGSIQQVFPIMFTKTGIAAGSHVVTYDYQFSFFDSTSAAVASTGSFETFNTTIVTAIA